MNSCLPDVDDDRECEWDADDGEEDAEDAARRRHRRDVAVTCDKFRWPKVYIFLWVTWCAISGRVPKKARFLNLGTNFFFGGTYHSKKIYGFHHRRVSVL